MYYEHLKGYKFSIRMLNWYSVILKDHQNTVHHKNAHKTNLTTLNKSVFAEETTIILHF